MDRWKEWLTLVLSASISVLGSASCTSLEMCVRKWVCVHKHGSRRPCVVIVRLYFLKGCSYESHQWDKRSPGLTFITPDENCDPKRRELSQSERSYYYIPANQSAARGRGPAAVAPQLLTTFRVRAHMPAHWPIDIYSIPPGESEEPLRRC